VEIAISDRDRETYIRCQFDTCTVCNSHQRAVCRAIRDEKTAAQKIMVDPANSN
jgi:hypothetical protein